MKLESKDKKSYLRWLKRGFWIKLHANLEKAELGIRIYERILYLIYRRMLIKRKGRWNVYVAKILTKVAKPRWPRGRRSLGELGLDGVIPYQANRFLALYKRNKKERKWLTAFPLYLWSSTLTWKRDRQLLVWCIKSFDYMTTNY